MLTEKEFYIKENIPFTEIPSNCDNCLSQLIVDLDKITDEQESKIAQFFKVIPQKKKSIEL